MRWRRFVLAMLMSLSVEAVPALAQTGYKKSTEGGDVVMNKMYPKKKRIEVTPAMGFILNQSYVNTILLGAGVNYFFSEEWGLGVDFAVGSNSDKDERGCIENFYNDPNDEVASPCGSANALGGTKANFGPAYVPIREIQNVISANLIWNPVYGKQLILLSATSYFDLFLEGGASLVSSRFYPKQETLRNGNKSRGEFDPNGDQLPPPRGPIGADVNDAGSYGVSGRPDPQSQNNVALNLGVGQKFHFGKSFHIKMYLRNMTILGTETGFDNLFALMVGAGLRF